MITVVVVMDAHTEHKCCSALKMYVIIRLVTDLHDKISFAGEYYFETLDGG